MPKDMVYVSGEILNSRSSIFALDFGLQTTGSEGIYKRTFSQMHFQQVVPNVDDSLRVPTQTWSL